MINRETQPNARHEQPAIMAPAEFAAALREIGGDQERRHVLADKLLCRVLRSLGYGEGVDVFESIEKWYG
jgi:hypothetical protein